MTLSRLTRLARAATHSSKTPAESASTSMVPGGDVPLGEDLTVGDVVLEYLVSLYGRENGGETIERSERILQQLAAGPDGFSLWRPVVLTTSELCALTAPGRCIYVSTGLIGALSDDAPLALALAHEIAHHTLGHVASAPPTQWRDCLGAASALSALAGPVVNRLLFSVEQEFAADREALNLCHRAGFNLPTCLDLYRIFSDWEETGRDCGVTFPGDRIGSSTALQRWMRARYSGYPRLAARREAAEVERILIQTARI